MKKLIVSILIGSLILNVSLSQSKSAIKKGVQENFEYNRTTGIGKINPNIPKEQLEYINEKYPDLVGLDLFFKGNESNVNWENFKLLRNISSIKITSCWRCVIDKKDFYVALKEMENITNFEFVLQLSDTADFDFAYFKNVKNLKIRSVTADNIELYDRHLDSLKKLEVLEIGWISLSWPKLNELDNLNTLIIRHLGFQEEFALTYLKTPKRLHIKFNDIEEIKELDYPPSVEILTFEMGSNFGNAEYFVLPTRLVFLLGNIRKMENLKFIYLTNVNSMYFKDMAEFKTAVQMLVSGLNPKVGIAVQASNGMYYR